MKLALMQPYFFPYLGYFQLINAVDNFIFFDSVQYIRKGFMNRNRILSGSKELIYIRVPILKCKRSTVIKDVQIANDLDWKKLLSAQISFYKNKAPFYDDTRLLIDKILAFDTESVSEFNCYSVTEICRYLNIKTNISIYSEMDFKFENVNMPDDWGLNVCKTLKADKYYNSSGGSAFYDVEKYNSFGIDIRFLDMYEFSYRQINDDFVKHLSIIDVLMFNDVKEIQKLLLNCRWI